MVVYVYERFVHVNALSRLADMLSVAYVVYGGLELRGVRPLWSRIEFAKSEVDVITVGFASRHGVSYVDEYFGVGIPTDAGRDAPYVYRSLQPAPYELLLSIDDVHYYKYDGWFNIPITNGVWVSINLYEMKWHATGNKRLIGLEPPKSLYTIVPTQISPFI